MKHQSNKVIFANSIVNLLQSSDIENIKLVGSISENKSDEYSDIDIELKDHKRSPVENINIALNFLSEKYNVLFSDWAKSLLPEKYVLSVFLKQKNIFSYIDLSCYQDINFPDVARDRLPQDKVYHIFKLWICNAKQEIRQRHDRNLIDSLYSKFYDINDSTPNSKKFEKILDWLHKNSDNEYLLNEFDKIIEKINVNT
jgi:predicted nucleotidyltransferase